MCQCPGFGRDRRAGEVDESNNGLSSNRGVPVPQIMEERVQQRTAALIIDVPVPQVMQEIVQVSRSLPVSASRRVLSQIVDVPMPQIRQRTVELIIDVPVQQDVEVIVQGVQIIFVEFISERIFTASRSANASNLEDIVELVRLTRESWM